MAFHKSVLYNPSAQLLAKQSIAIDYPVRSKILLDLMTKEKSAIDLLVGQKISRTTLLGHLKLLLDVQYIGVDKFQKIPIYRLNPDEIPIWIYFNLMHHPEANRNIIIHYLPKELKSGITKYINSLAA